jgi:hypothetical protein
VSYIEIEDSESEEEEEEEDSDFDLGEEEDWIYGLYCSQSSGNL